MTAYKREMLGKIIGARFKSIRKRQGFTQEDVEAAVGVTQPTISAWELGKTFSQLDKIEEAVVKMGASPDELLAPEALDADLTEIVALWGEVDEDAREAMRQFLRLRAKSAKKMQNAG